MQKIQPYLFLVFLGFVGIGIFYPFTGIAALLCMLAPVVIFAPFAGRYWCGNVCPRGSFYDTLLARISPKKPIPAFFKSKVLRFGMLALIMTVFSVQTYNAWGNTEALGLIFLRLIIITTLIGIILGVIYHHRTWCSFCPMGTLASLLAPKKNVLLISNDCVNCKLCEKVCPSGLAPYTAKGLGQGFYSADCMHCNRCVSACPKKAINLK